ncbi:hypothetical protein [Acinetobacter pittii]|nr:hypothetical protein [Acinetobacter pittii]MCH2020784.1 hypothetical protein [Acinetobacter pittii]
MFTRSSFQTPDMAKQSEILGHMALLHKGLKDRVILSNSILSDNLGVRSA